MIGGNPNEQNLELGELHTLYEARTSSVVATACAHTTRIYRFSMMQLTVSDWAAL
jgi:hypothetical protein